jgi:hypothetical protein
MRKFDFEGGWIDHDALKPFVYNCYNQAKKPAAGVLATTVLQPRSRPGSDVYPTPLACRATGRRC